MPLFLTEVKVIENPVLEEKFSALNVVMSHVSEKALQITVPHPETKFFNEEIVPFVSRFT